MERKFGISTHLFHDSPLTREHLVHVAAHGFEAIELFATRSHFDYHDAGSVEQLGGWLADTGLQLHSVHAPIVERIQNGQWVNPYSTAAGDERRRSTAVAEIESALRVATRIPFRFLVLHLGTPAGDHAMASDNQPAAARRSIEAVVNLAAVSGVRVAVEVLPNALSTAEAIVHLIEEQLDGLDVGICLDYGHAHLMGDLAEAIETVSGHLWTTHVHDNGGRRDDHLVPYSGTIDWGMAMMETQKIGYDDTLIFEVGRGDADPVSVLQRCAEARRRLEDTFVAF